MHPKKSLQIKQPHIIALFAGPGALSGYLFKQINPHKHRKLKFMKALSDNLYPKHLDNNAGLFYHLIDANEDYLQYVPLSTAKQQTDYRGEKS
jgi:hypothetical protein